MSRRKHISLKTKLAAALLDGRLIRERFGLDPKRWYRDAKEMTEDQFLSLFQFDHNMLESTAVEDRNRYWNLAPMLILAHREKTKVDAKVIAKGRRIRAGWGEHVERMIVDDVDDPKGRRRINKKWYSRGFDKRLRRKMDGTVVKR